MIFLYYFGAALLIWLSTRSLISGIRYFRFFQRETSKLPTDTDRFVTVLLPCRGVDIELEYTIAALLEQDYKKYEILVIVDRESDAAAIRRMLPGSSGSIPAKLVIAPAATTCSQKIQNLLTGMTRTSDETDVFVFVDSDATPRRDLLKQLVSAVSEPGVGAASGYRWYLPEKSSLAGELRAAWNASIASALGPNRRNNFCWGGSMAISRSRIEQLNIPDLWRTAVSDDFVLTQAVKKAGLDVAHVPQALCVSTDGCSFAELMEFTTRQMKITRIYSRDLWLVSLVGSAAFNLVMLASIGVLVFNKQTQHRAVAAFTLIAVTVLSLAKAFIRVRAVSLALPEHQKRLHSQIPAQLVLTMVTPLIFFINCIGALFSRTIAWRGTRYELKSPRETVIISD